jgi:DNA-binding MarR family transcriptional regulator
MLQAADMAAQDQDIRLLAAQLDTSWVEIGRSFLSRRAPARVQTGIAAELSPIQLHALGLLAEQPRRVGELAGSLGLADSSASRLVDRLESLGLVDRRHLATDRRVVEVELTKDGRALAAETARRRREYLTVILDALQPGEREELVRLFKKVASMQAHEPSSSRNHRKRSS